MEGAPKKRGRPRLSEEEKARRAIERKASKPVRKVKEVETEEQKTFREENTRMLKEFSDNATKSAWIDLFVGRGSDGLSELSKWEDVYDLVYNLKVKAQKEKDKETEKQINSLNRTRSAANADWRRKMTPEVINKAMDIMEKLMKKHPDYFKGLEGKDKETLQRIKQFRELKLEEEVQPNLDKRMSRYRKYKERREKELHPEKKPLPDPKYYPDSEEDEDYQAAVRPRIAMAAMFKRELGGREQPKVNKKVAPPKPKRDLGGDYGDALFFHRVYTGLANMATL